MNNSKKLIFQKRPGIFKTFGTAFINGKHKMKFGGKIHDIQAEWQNYSLNNKKIDKFNDICMLEKTDSINILYPFTIIYPINLLLISQREIPVPMFKMLTIRNTTTMHRNIKRNEKLAIVSKSSGQNFLENGMEFYIDSEIKSDGQTVWENKSTLFIPGKSKEENALYKPFRLEQIPDAGIEKQWFLPAKNGFNFAGIIGDSNGIHYSRRYAQMMGFKRDFAQPVLVSSKSIESLPGIPGQGSLKLDLFFKGPVYYNSMLTLKNVSERRSNRFDLYCEGNDRPCISGKIERI